MVGVLLGSPPHTRGAVAVTLFCEFAVGITPAYAGSSASSLWWIQLVTDHPRIRGEQSGVPLQGAGPRGSPPHTRGADRMRCLVGLVYRITPAYAGSSRLFSSASRRRWDHPRIRGEQ